MDNIIVDFIGCRLANIWSFISDKQSECQYIARKWYISTCLYALSTNIKNKYISGTLSLAFYTKEDPSIQYNYCFDLNSYKEYVQILSQYLPFKYHFKTQSCNDLPKNYIEIEIHNMYTEFMFILTAVRYGYEIPSSPLLLDILELYHALAEKIDIINCINLVLGFNRATHGHETQCLFPYVTNSVPKFIEKKLLLSRLIMNNQYLINCFDLQESEISEPIHNKPCISRLVTESFLSEKAINTRLEQYINYINKWERKFLL